MTRTSSDPTASSIPRDILRTARSGDLPFALIVSSCTWSRSKPFPSIFYGSISSQ
ncbi:hypothetical protein K525DRAFT_261726 [Schizophyllum commune Loenen D]|nr:hypothetical protein K525DRAFT_261726 [Schizophyllum commune Loenen D]